LIYFAGSRNDTDTKISRWDGIFGLPGIELDLTDNLEAAGYNTNLKISDIDVSRTDFSDVYVSVAGLDADGKVFKSDNAGNSWENLTFNLPNVPMFSIKVDEAGGLYVGSSIGVYYLPNGQDYWVPFYNNLPHVPISEIELGPGAPPYSKVYVSTFGRGIWSADTFIANCPDYVSKTGLAAGREYYEANIELSSPQILKGDKSTELKLSSGSSIKLLPGFHARQASFMKTYLEGCGADVLDN